MTLSQRISLIALPALLATSFGCKREYDSPPVRTIPTGSVLTIAQLRALFFDQPSPLSVHFSDSTGAPNTVYAVVTADEENGNLYKNIYVQDHTGAITLHLLNSGGFYQGDSIRLYLPGCVLSPYNGLLQLDSVDVDNNVVKQATNVYVAPTPTTLSALMTQTGLTGNLQSKLISLSGVEFAASDTGTTYADPINQTTINRNIEDCNGGAAIVRTSGYANFAGQHLPTGKGSFVGIASYFGSAAQLYIRDINEVQMNGPRCGMASCAPAATLQEDFSSVQSNMNVNLECWLNVFTLPGGSNIWKGKILDSESFAEVAAPSFGSAPMDAWLITAPMTFSTGMSLSFESGLGSAWQHDGLSVMVSTDIDLTDGNSVASAPWVNVTGVPLANSTTTAGSTTTLGSWVPSGNIPLDAYLSEGDNFVIAFKYAGTPSTEATRYRIDNVTIQ